MTWFKVDDTLALHPKAVAAGNLALGLWVRAGAWCSQQLTEGFIPAAVIPMLGGRPRDVKALLAAGLWTEEPGGYRFHQWAERNPSREQVEADREAARERQRRARERAREAREQAASHRDTRPPNSPPSRRDFPGESHVNDTGSHGPPDPTRPVVPTELHPPTPPRPPATGRRDPSPRPSTADQRVAAALRLADQLDHPTPPRRALP